MHFLQNLLRYMIPIVPVILNNSEDLPIGESRVITSTGNFVITSRNSYVVAKTY